MGRLIHTFGSHLPTQSSQFSQKWPNGIENDDDDDDAQYDDNDDDGDDDALAERGMVRMITTTMTKG